LYLKEYAEEIISCSDDKRRIIEIHQERKKSIKIIRNPSTIIDGAVDLESMAKGNINIDEETNV
jgi:hypothetical protein